MPEIMTLKDFLRKYPNMEKMRKTAIVPVPITDAKHIEMIEKLAKKELNVHQNNNHQKSKLHHQHHDIGIVHLYSICIPTEYCRIGSIFNKKIVIGSQIFSRLKRLRRLNILFSSFFSLLGVFTKIYNYEFPWV